MKQPWYLPTKHLPRRLATLPIGRRVRLALFMPGLHMHCVRAALAAGTIDRRTRCIFIERDPQVAAEIRRQSAEFDWVAEPYLHVGPIAALNLHGLLGGDRIDYAFLDFCAALSLPRALWIAQQVAPALADDAALAVTLCRTVRNSRFADHCRKYFRTCGRREADAACRKLRDATCVGNTEITDVRAACRQPTAHIAKNPVFLDDDDVVPPVFHTSSIQAVGTLQGILSQHDFHVDACVEYHHGRQSYGTRMGMVRLGNIRRTNRRRSPLLATAARAMPVAGYDVVCL